ncbi:MAG: hypothetical protein ACRD82_06170 [Blastocatellia bacterium]
MPHSLSFDFLYHYDNLKAGIEIPATLKLGDQIVFCQAKVDPGAQVCLFKRDLGDALGLDIERGESIDLDSLGGTIRAFGHSLTLVTLGIEVDSVVHFAADYGLRRNLLGREGWLQKVRLAIVDYDTALYLSPYDEKL